MQTHALPQRNPKWNQDFVLGESFSSHDSLNLTGALNHSLSQRSRQLNESAINFHSSSSLHKRSTNNLNRSRMHRSSQSVIDTRHTPVAPRRAIQYKISIDDELSIQLRNKDAMGASILVSHYFLIIGGEKYK